MLHVFYVWMPKEKIVVPLTMKKIRKYFIEDTDSSCGL